MLAGTITAGDTVALDAAVLETDPLVACAPDEILRRTTDAARRLLKAPRAALSSFAALRQLIVCSSEPSEIGREMPLSYSLCHHVVTAGIPIAAEVAAEHAAFADVVPTSDVVAYAGAPIKLASGAILGTLCVSDRIPHAWTGEDLDVLAVLAAGIGDAVDQRLAVRRSEVIATAARRELDRVLAVADAMPGFVFERRKLGPTQVAYSILGTSKAALVPGRELTEHGDRAPLTFVHPEDREGLRAEFLRSTEEETGLDVTFRASPDETRQRWLRCQMIVRRGKDGAVSWAGHCFDVTDLIDARDTAEMRCRSGFVDANHAIRTPLQSILGSTEFLASETRPDVIAAHAQTIRSASAAVLTVVDQTLDPAKPKVDEPAADHAAPAEATAEANGDAPTIPSQEPAEAERASGARILLADDLDLNRRLIADMLSYEGYSVDCVADGAAAVEAAGERRYDLILMDMIMPGMDGVAATRAIRAMPEPVCRVPIVALTAHSFREQLDACLAAGMDGTLTKPLSMATLTSAVESWTRGRNEAA